MNPSKWEKGLLVLYFKYLLFVCGLTLYILRDKCLRLEYLMNE